MKKRGSRSDQIKDTQNIQQQFVDEFYRDPHERKKFQKMQQLE